jgi:hypothetical protein
MSDPQTTLYDAWHVIEGHKYLLQRIRDELTLEIEKLISLQLAMKKELQENKP